SSAPIGAASAAEAAALLSRALEDVRRGVGEAVLQLAEDRTGVTAAAEQAQRQAELQQAVGRLRAARVVLVGDAEGARRLVVVAAHVVGLAQPVLGVRRERVARMLLDEGGQRLLGAGVVGLAQQTEGVVVLLLR